MVLLTYSVHFKVYYTHHFPASTLLQTSLLPLGQLEHLLAFVYCLLLFFSVKSYQFKYKLNPVLQTRLPFLSPFYSTMNSQLD